VLAFYALLRERDGFAIGHREAHDALRALDCLGIRDADRVRTALCAIACASPEQIAIFDRAFDEFFLTPERGLPQSAYRPRHTRPGTPAAQSDGRPEREERGEPHDTDDGASAQSPAREHRVTDTHDDDATAWQLMRARYSPTAALAPSPAISAEGLGAMEAAARKVVRSVRLGRSRRWRPQPHGRRFDVRRTLRASLQTGGDPVVLHRLGPPPRSPKFAVLVDGSRSMSTYAESVLSFAYALGRASVRARTYLFSTELIDVTRILRKATPGEPLPDLGEAWGGGTRIGASLARFVREYGAQALDDQTLVIVASDGLDAGDGVLLGRAMKEIARRAAAVVWLNPHARSRGFAPTAGGMRAALPFVDVLDAATSASDFERIADRLARGGRRVA